MQHKIGFVLHICKKYWKLYHETRINTMFHHPYIQVKNTTIWLNDVFTLAQVTQVWWASTRHTCGHCIRRFSRDIQCGLWAMLDTVCLQKALIWLKVRHFPLYIHYGQKYMDGLHKYPYLAVKLLTGLLYISHCEDVKLTDHLHWGKMWIALYLVNLL